MKYLLLLALAACSGATPDSWSTPVQQDAQTCAESTTNCLKDGTHIEECINGIWHESALMCSPGWLCREVGVGQASCVCTISNTCSN